MACHAEAVLAAVRVSFGAGPSFMPEHDPADWRCCFCDPIPHGSGPCDFCGVPDSMLKQPSTEERN